MVSITKKIYGFDGILKIEFMHKNLSAQTGQTLNWMLHKKKTSKNFEGLAMLLSCCEPSILYYQFCVKAN